MLSACGPTQNPNEIFDRFEVREVVILDVNPPKHFSVTVKDRQSGAVFKDVANSTWCPAWRSTTTIGAHYTVPSRVYLNTETGRRTFYLMDSYLNEQLC